MNTKDPKLIALQFNECITDQNIDELARLMSDGHTFIDRERTIHRPKDFMIDSWKKFFELFPKYKNIFTRIESHDNLVVMLGHAFWSDEQPHDAAIWTATIIDDLVAEWHIYYDTPEERRKFGLL